MPSNTEKVLEEAAQLLARFGRAGAEELWVPFYWNKTAAAVMPLPVSDVDVFVRYMWLGGTGSNYVFVTLASETAAQINTGDGHKAEVLAAAYVSTTGVPAAPWIGRSRIKAGQQAWVSIFAAGTVFMSWSRVVDFNVG